MAFRDTSIPRAAGLVPESTVAENLRFTEFSKATASVPSLARREQPRESSRVNVDQHPARPRSLFFPERYSPAHSASTWVSPVSTSRSTDQKSGPALRMQVPSPRPEQARPDSSEPRRYPRAESLNLDGPSLMDPADSSRTSSRSSVPEQAPLSTQSPVPEQADTYSVAKLGCGAPWIGYVAPWSWVVTQPAEAITQSMSCQSRLSTEHSVAVPNESHREQQETVPTPTRLSSL